MVKPVSETYRQADTLSTKKQSLANRLHLPNVVSKVIS